jgi:hypothetical protein
VAADIANTRTPSKEQVLEHWGKGQDQAMEDRKVRARIGLAKTMKVRARQGRLGPDSVHYIAHQPILSGQPGLPGTHIKRFIFSQFPD